jgi:hypothetical protein
MDCEGCSLSCNVCDACLANSRLNLSFPAVQDRCLCCAAPRRNRLGHCKRGACGMSSAWTINTSCRHELTLCAHQPGGSGLQHTKLIMFCWGHLKVHLSQPPTSPLHWKISDSSPTCEAHQTGQACCIRPSTRSKSYARCVLWVAETWRQLQPSMPLFRLCSCCREVEHASNTITLT